MQNRPQTITKARFRRFCRLVGKGMNFFGILKRFSLKYLAAAFVVVLFTEMVFGFAPHAAIQRPAATDVAAADSGSTDNERRAQRLSRRERRRMKQAAEAKEPPVVSDTLVLQADSLLPPDSLRVPSDSLQRDTTRRKKEGGAFLEDIMNGKNTDSLVYDIRNKMVYIYNEGDINYQDMNLKADFMRVNMDTREIYAYGKPDTLEGQPTVTRPEFTEGSASPYKMDTITYNFKSGKAKIKGVATQEGDGWLIGGSVKKMPDNNINIQGGKYTTCDQTDHPHFYLAMTKAKVIPGKKVVTGPAYLVMEDVPIYFLGIPEGFFPISSGPKSGFLMPTYGEDGQRGFFFRDFGYYFTLSQHMDLALTAASTRSDRGREPPHRATSNATSTRATSTPSSRASAPARRANPTSSNRTPSACNGRTRRIRRPTRAPPSPHRSTSPRAVTPNTRPRRSTTFSRHRPTRRSPTRRTGREPLSRSR